MADTGSEGQGPCAGDPAALHKGLGDAYVEVSENSESWEPSAPEASAEPFDTQSPQAGPQLGKKLGFIVSKPSPVSSLLPAPGGLTSAT